MAQRAVNSAPAALMATLISTLMNDRTATMQAAKLVANDNVRGRSLRIP